MIDCVNFISEWNLGLSHRLVSSRTKSTHLLLLLRFLFLNVSIVVFFFKEEEGEGAERGEAALVVVVKTAVLLRLVVHCASIS